MRYYPTKKQDKYKSASKVPTQKELIEQMNAHTRFTRKLAELLVSQATLMTQEERKYGK